jgi:hypothetical protein
MLKKEYKIIAPAWSKVINQRFIPLISCKDKHIICYGSRGSSKSYWAAETIVDRCVNWSNYSCLVIRAEENKHLDSTFKLLKATIDKNGYTNLFKCTVSPLKIKCINGNEIIFRGMDDIDKIKGLEGINAVWFEEEIPKNENDFETVTLTVRANNVPFIQYIYTINPTIPDHENHWFYKRWFLDKNGNEEIDLSFRKCLSLETDDGEIIEEWATVHHSTYLDNRWLNKQTKNQIELLKLKDPYTYATQALGRWSAKVPGGRFWKLFDIQRNSVRTNKYNEDLPIHLSFDFNKNPGMHVGIYQIDGYTVRQIDEIALRNPNNRTTDACETFIRRYENHTSGVYIYGDPNGYKEDSSTEKGYNNFAIIFELLKKYKPQDRTIRKAPPVAKSAEWINEIFFSKLDGIEIIIPEDCKESIADMIYTQEMPDGTVFKPKIKPDKNESAYEKFGHFSDLLRYFMTVAFKTSFETHKNGGMKFKPLIAVRKRDDDNW